MPQKDKADSIVKITKPRHAGLVSRWLGLLEAADALDKKTKEFDRLPGFELARAIIQRQVSECRAAAVAENLRAVAASGVDVAKVSDVALEVGKDGSLQLVVTMMDLADIAEAVTS